MPMFMRSRSMTHKEVDFFSYVDSKFADLKEKFVKELKEGLLSSITSLINEQNRQIENLNEKLTKQNSTISVLQIMWKFLMNNVRNYGRILIPNVTSWNNTLDANVFELKEL